MLETAIKWALIIVGAYLVVRVGLKFYRQWRGVGSTTAADDGTALPLANGEPDNAAFISPPAGGTRYGGYSEAGGVRTANSFGRARDPYDADRRQYFLRRV
jgi:hypothetical protein